MQPQGRPALGHPTPSAASRANRASLLPEGTWLGRYEIITYLASGGMATVYLAQMSGAAGFQRLVAIKRLHAHIAGDDQFTKMFMDEARLAARIRHPNVVPTLDLENGEDGLYLAMEFVDGDSLLGLLKTAAKGGSIIPPSIVLRILIDTLHGLNAAHDLKGDRGEPLNLVHRDVSPHNILVGLDGVARITDFGVARAEDRVSQSRDGQIKGKLAYMAPEMTAAVPFDRRADVFSAGIVLWECLTGRRLFKGSSDAELLRSLIDSPIPRIRDIVPQYPRSLDAVVAKALERNQEARYKTAGELADDLESAGAAIGIATPKALSAYVESAAAERIDEVRATVHAWTSGASRRARLVVVPSDLPRGPSMEAIEPSSMTPSASDYPHAVHITSTGISARPTGRAFMLGALAAALVVLGALAATAILLLGQKAAPAPTRTFSESPSVTSPAIPTTAPPSPSDSVPTLDLTRPDPLARTAHAGSHASSAALPSASASASASAPATSASGAPSGSSHPAPSSSAFNPEAM